MKVSQVPEAKRPPKVLTLLASYNGARWIRQQLESIFAQEGVDVWVTVRDDGSSDETLQELARCKDLGRLRVSPSRERTGSAASNFLELVRENSGADFAFVAFADQDDVWHPDKLQRACRRLTETGGSGYSSATLAAWPHGKTVLLSQAGALTRGDFLFEGAGQGCTFVLRADFYARVRRFVLENAHLVPCIHYHDWMLYALARSWGCSWTFDPWPSVTYRQHASNDTGARGSWTAVRRRLGLIRSGWYRAQLEAIATVCAAAAPGNPLVLEWNSLLADKTGLGRRWRIARFCLSTGRRRRLDNAALVLAAVTGWI
jgi:rhamnosyltransferase